MDAGAQAASLAVEQALRAAHTRYRDLMDNAACGILHTRTDGTILEVNQAWATVLGYDTSEQYLTEVANARNVWEEPAQRAVFLRAVAEHGVVQGFEARLRHRNGGIVWVALHARAVRDEGGALVELHTSGLDITAGKLAEQILRESEARFRSVFLHSLDGILLATTDGQILSANPAACQILDRTEPELQALGRGGLLDIGDDRLAAALAPLAPRAARGAAHVVTAMTRPDGSCFPAEVTCSAFTDADGVANVAMIIRDVSERQHAEHELRGAKQAADAASQAKNEFLSRMSHELRTPLNAVLGFAQLLELDLEGEHRKSVQQICRAGRHLLELINEVLDISRIEAGQLALSPEPVRVWDLIEETLALMAPLAAARGVTFDCPPAARCQCHARTDRQRAKQVLLNLLSNAVKYNHPGGTVAVRCRAPDQAWVAIEVADTGIGIPAHDLSRLFTPFERLGAAQSDIEGTGVGLALSLRLAQAMDGDLQVDSELGQGTTFRFRLPSAAQPIPHEVSAMTPQDQPEDAARRGPVGTVLSIEDNLANTCLLEQIIARRPGWAIVTAATGRLGIDLAVGDPPDLILLDLHLPDISGAEVLHRLKASPATAAIPVVILSADATPGQVERLHDAGAHGYLTKPIDVSTLLDVLDQLDQLTARDDTERG